MRNEIGEPTGMHVRHESGAEETLEFAAFVAAIECGDVGAHDEVHSHIVTQDRWLCVGEMQLYREIRQGVERAEAARESVWPPAPQQE